MPDWVTSPQVIPVLLSLIGLGGGLWAYLSSRRMARTQETVAALNAGTQLQVADNTDDAAIRAMLLQMLVTLQGRYDLLLVAHIALCQEILQARADERPVRLDGLTPPFPGLPDTTVAAPATPPPRSPGAGGLG